MNIGWQELAVILVIVMLLFGSRLPTLGKSLGQGIRNFKKGLAADDGDKEGDEKVNQAGQATERRESQTPAQIAARQVNPQQIPGQRTDGARGQDVVDVEHRDVSK